MWTRHFHTTFLAVVGFMLILLVSYIFGQKSVMHIGNIPTSLHVTITPTPTPSEQYSFLYYDYFQNYYTFFLVDAITGQKQGIYGTTDSINEYSIFNLFNNQIYMSGKQSAGVLNLYSHFFYPSANSGFPLTVSPDQQKALFLITNNFSNNLQSNQYFSLLQPQDKPANKKLKVPFVLGTDPQPVCWSHEQNSILFHTTANAYYLYSITHQDAVQIVQSIKPQYVYCNSQTDTLYSQTADGLYEQKLTGTSMTKLPIKQNLVSQISTLIFSSTYKSNKAITTINKKLDIINLETGATKTIYNSTDSANLTPFLWADKSVLFTQQGTNMNGGYYIQGKMLNLTNQVDTIFADHEAQNFSSLGLIIPIGILMSQSP